MFSPAFRVALYYALLFSVVGIHLPFWPVWLSARGLNPEQIGAALATAYLGRALITPLAGWLMDHLGEHKRPLVLVAMASTLVWSSFSLIHSVSGIILLSFWASGLWACLFPMGDIMALASAARWGFDYGRIRLWGSISFIAASLGAGSVLGWVAPEVLVWLISGALGLTVLGAVSLPDIRPLDHQRGRGSFKDLLAIPCYRWFLLTTALNQAGHTVLYGFATLHWQKAGLSSELIGLLWGEGVLAEILVFALAAPLLRAIRPEKLLLLALMAGVVRWTALSLTSELPWLMLIQILHAATFCCAHLGAMYFLQSAIPASMGARAQSLFSGVASGITPGLMVPVAGWAYQHFDGGAFILMSMTALLGTGAAWMLIRSRNGID